MIEVKVKKRNDKYIGFSYSGHANYDEYGFDIVCAGVTAQVEMIYNGLEYILKVPMELKMSPEGGFLEFMIEDNEKSINKAQDLMATLNLGLKAIKSQYNENITLIEEEV